MKTQDDVPFSLAELDARWLNQTLSEQGVISDIEIESIDVKGLGDGIGFNGELALVHLNYNDAKSIAPTTMVAKIPTASKNRILGQTMGLYEREIRFYRDLAPQLKINTPQHYCSALDVADDPDVIAERMEGLNKMPMWLIGVLTVLGKWLVGKTPRRYVLLIEDLTEHRIGNQDEGCSISDTTQILNLMANLHGQFWNSQQLQDMSWIAPLTMTSRIVHSMYTPIKKSLDRDAYSPQQLEVIDWVLENGIELTERLGGEIATVLHGDVRLDNICFNDRDNEITLLDWQTLHAGPPGFELAYFFSATLPANLTATDVDSLIEHYHQELTQNGASLSLKRLRWQYQLGMLAMLQRILPQCLPNQMDTGISRDISFFETWVDRIFERIDSNYSTALNVIPD